MICNLYLNLNLHLNHRRYSVSKERANNFGESCEHFAMELRNFYNLQERSLTCQLDYEDNIDVERKIDIHDFIDKHFQQNKKIDVHGVLFYFVLEYESDGKMVAAAVVGCDAEIRDAVALRRFAVHKNHLLLCQARARHFLLLA